MPEELVNAPEDVMMFNVELASQEVLSRLDKDPHLRKFIDRTIPLPAVFKGADAIKLIIVGQDPTVQNPLRRKQITMVLDLDNDSHLREYFKDICEDLQIGLDQDVYATNFFKNFFIEPPTEIIKRENGKFDLLGEFAEYWLPLLKKEIEQFPSVPIITIGEPMLKHLVRLGHENEVKHYWGYNPEWRDSIKGEFKHIKPEANHLGRAIFPFPHLNSMKMDFYRFMMPNYVNYARITGINQPQFSK